MSNYTFEPAATAAFTGHRTMGGVDGDTLRERLSRAVDVAYGNGMRNFLTGMAMGFDMMAAEVVLERKTACPDMTLTAVIPCHGQDRMFSVCDRERYHRILQSADEVIVLSETYYRGCFFVRDRFLVEHSRRMISYYDGRRSGGTYWTIRLASRMCREVTNVFSKE